MIDQRVSLQTAVVLHQRPFKNTSAIVEFFTRDYGRVAALAQGLKRKNSKWQGVLQPFQLMQISWQGRGELPRLTAAEPLGQIHYFVGESMFSALYVNELLLRVLHKGEAVPDLFSSYLTTIEHLLHDYDTVALRRFELVLLRTLGYELQLSHEAQSACAIQAEQEYCFIPGEGMFLLDDMNSHALRFRGANLLAIDEDDFSNVQVAKDARIILRLALQRVLGDKPLHTRELLRRFKEMQRTAQQVPD